MAYLPPDGSRRGTDAERQINEAFKLTFAGQAGELVLSYLKSITINAVAGPGIHPDHLMHLEGQRFVVGLIEKRIRYGIEDQPPKEKTDGSRTRRSQTGRE